MDANDAAPNIVVELVNGHGEVLAYLMADSDNSRTVFLDDQHVAGTSDHFDALAIFLDAAIDRQATAGTCSMQFSPWLVEELERRCESADIAADDFLRSLLPSAKRLAELPQLCVL